MHAFCDSISLWAVKAWISPVSECRRFRAHLLAHLVLQTLCVDHYSVVCRFEWPRLRIISRVLPTLVNDHTDTVKHGVQFGYS